MSSNPDIRSACSCHHRFRRDILEDNLAEAQRTPSNYNTHPWNVQKVHIVSGNMLGELSATLIEAMRSGNYSLDFSFDQKAYPAPYRIHASDQERTY
jgi:hypothetical protein